jgi:hypothetical protein
LEDKYKEKTIGRNSKTGTAHICQKGDSRSSYVCREATDDRSNEGNEMGIKRAIEIGRAL